MKWPFNRATASAILRFSNLPLTASPTNVSATRPIVPKMMTTPVMESRLVQMRPNVSSSRTSLKPTVVRVMIVMYSPSPIDQPSTMV